MNILIVVTSHARLGETGYKTGLWLDVFAESYFAIVEAGAEITLASPAGGQPPIDPRSDEPQSTSAALRRFRCDHRARALLADTLQLEQIYGTDFDGLLFSDGYGSMWDIANSQCCANLVAEFHAKMKPVAFVCHGAAALCLAKDADGLPLVMGKAVTSCANSELVALGLDHVMPFSMQDRLITLGARYSKGPDWQPYVVRDGPLITGQNPKSAIDVTRKLLGALG